MAELGSIEKPNVSDYIHKKKIYCVPNVYSYNEAPDQFKQLVDKYWNEVNEQLLKLEIAGKINKIFVEFIVSENDQDWDLFKKANPNAVNLIEQKKSNGAKLVLIEDKSVLGQFMDWSNCLNVIGTKEVFAKVMELYTEVSKKRQEVIKNGISQNLAKHESGLLIMNDQDRSKIEFEKDVEIFLVTPPSYDDVLKWFRDLYK